MAAGAAGVRTGHDLQVTSIGQAVAQVLAALPEPSAGRSTLICVEGLGGAGKSTLAEAVVNSRPHIALVRGDEFYGPEERDWRSWTPPQGYERYFDHRRLEAQVLRPVWCGLSARYQRYDWDNNVLAGWAEVDPGGMVIVEGVYLLRPRLRPYWDLAVYVDTPRQVRQRRLHARGENDSGWIARWTAAEDYYERVHTPTRAADIVVEGF